MILAMASARTWVQVWHWPWQPPAVLAAGALAWLYTVGLTRTVGTVTWRLRLRVASFYASLAIALATLESPARTLASTSFAWNLAQHVLLLLAAAPLAVAAAPWPVLRAGLPLRTLRYGISPPRRPGSPRVSRWPLRLLSHPRTPLIAFVACLWLPHLPGIFGLLIRHPLIDEAVCLGYLAIGLWFWSKLIDSSPQPGLPAYRTRIELIAGALFASWLAGAAMLISGRGSRPSYLPLPGVSAQQTLITLHQAGAVLCGPVTLPFELALIFTMTSWLSRGARPGTLSQTWKGGGNAS